jgi:hypothetical protein
VYAATIAELGPALRLIRAVEITGGGKVSKATLPSARGCGRKIRVSKSILAVGAILCGACGTDFALAEPDASAVPGGEGQGDEFRAARATRQRRDAAS